MLVASGVHSGAIIACDKNGTLHSRRGDIEQAQDEFLEKWELCRLRNAAGCVGGIAEALRGSDVCVAFSTSGPNIIRPEWIKEMAEDAIVVACANPVPEIWPWDAMEAGARIVATGRSDFANQVNNSLCFPGVFRGAIDVQANRISDEMAMAVAEEICATAVESGLKEDRIVPRMDEWEIYPRIAAPTALKAQEQAIAKTNFSRLELIEIATEKIRQARADIHSIGSNDQGCK